jgi:hypothetical protein
MVDMTAYTEGAEDGYKEFNRTQYTRVFNPGRYFSLGVTVKL